MKMLSKSPSLGRWSKRGLFPLAFLLIFLLPGCASLDRSRYEGVSRFGANGQATMRVGPLIRSKSLYFIPGQTESQRPSKRVRCTGERVQLRLVRGDETSAHYADELCEAASATVDFLDREIGKVDGRFTIDVIPEGLSRSFLRTRYGRYPHHTFAIPSFEDREITVRNIVDLIGHEGFHIYASSSGQRQRSSNENLAYMHGLCAQLDVIGSIHESFLPGAPLQNWPSSSAAEATRHFIQPLLENGSIRVNTASALKIIERCEADE